MITAKSVAEAKRTKQIALIDAQREAEREATKIRLAAAAHKDAAQDRADAVLEEAQADAIAIKTQAKKADLLAEAEGRQAITNAENNLSEALIAMKIDMARLEAMLAIIAEMVKPAEKIDSIKIHHISEMNGASLGAGGTMSGDKPIVNQALDSIMDMAVQMPALKKLGDELGLSMENGLAGVTSKALGVDPVASILEASLETYTPAKADA